MENNENNEGNENNENNDDVLDSKYSLASIMRMDYENKLCCDCRGVYPTYISINHGILICHNCAQKHAELGYNISYVRNIDDEWDQYLFAFILRGGNSRFIRFAKQYRIINFPISTSYLEKY